jgi:hypothetical protein
VGLPERLREALDRAEEVAKRAAVHNDGSGVWRVSGGGLASGSYLLLSPYSAQSLGSRPLEHMAANDPAHVLRIIQAHRKITDEHEIVEMNLPPFDLLCVRCHEALCPTLAALASIYFPESDAAEGGS